MSVPVGERDETKFTLPLRAERLASYTLQITANEKVVLPEHRKGLTDDIVETAKNIYLGIREANDVTVRVDTIYQMGDFRDRNRIQQQALRNTKRLMYLIDLAHRDFHLSSKRVKYWGSMVREIRKRIEGWIADDQERYMPK